MKKQLKVVVQAKVNSQSLSDNQLAELQKLQNKIEPPKSRQRFWLIASVAAVILVTVFSLKNFLHQERDMVQLIASEVVANHLHLKPLEVNTATIDGIQQYFTQLTFKPIKTVQVPDLSEKLLGGRYCSLQGISAAQLRLKNKNSATLNTLYETEYRKDIFGVLPDINKGEKPVTAWAKGIEVKIWVENDVLFAMTLVD
jgi:hypothetical protein